MEERDGVMTRAVDAAHRMATEHWVDIPWSDVKDMLDAARQKVMEI